MLRPTPLYGQRRRRQLHHQLPPPNWSSLNCLQLKLSPRCLVSQTVGQCYCLILLPFDLPGYVTIQSPAYAGRRECLDHPTTDSIGLITASDHRRPVRLPNRCDTGAARCTSHCRYTLFKTQQHCAVQN